MGAAVALGRGTVACRGAGPAQCTHALHVEPRLRRDGDLDCALEHATRAVQLDPVHPLGLGLGPSLAAGPVDIHLAEGRYADAVDEYVRIATLRGARAGEIDALRAAFAEGGITEFWRCWVDVDMRLSGGAPDPLRMAAVWVLAGDSGRHWTGSSVPGPSTTPDSSISGSIPYSRS